MLRQTLKTLAIFVATATLLSGCIPGYGYGTRPGYYGGGYSGYSYRTTVYRPAGGGWRGGRWGYSGGGFHGGGCRGHR